MGYYTDMAIHAASGRLVSKSENIDKIELVNKAFAEMAKENKVSLSEALKSNVAKVLYEFQQNPSVNYDFDLDLAILADNYSKNAVVSYNHGASVIKQVLDQVSREKEINLDKADSTSLMALIYDVKRAMEKELAS